MSTITMIIPRNIYSSPKSLVSCFFLSFFVSGFCFFAFLFCGFRQRLSELSHLSELKEEEEDGGSDWEDDDDVAKR